MSLNKLTTVEAGLDCKFDIQAESLRCEGAIVENSDESLLTSPSAVSTKIYSTTILSTSGTDGFLTWSWNSVAQGIACLITSSVPLSPNYCVFTTAKAFAQVVRPSGVVKLSNTQFLCSFMLAVTGQPNTLQQGEFDLTLIYSA